MYKLDLACGENKCSPDFIGVDQKAGNGVDIIWDLNKYPYPFEDNSVDEIYCSEFIEHVENLVAFMDELYRIMKPGAGGLITAPYWSHINTWRDPTHRRGIADKTLFFFDKSWRDSNGKTCYDINSDFSVSYQMVFDEGYLPEYEKLSTEEQIFAITHYVNVVSGIRFEITKKG